MRSAKSEITLASVSGTQVIRTTRCCRILVNHIGHFLGFEVTFGRYRGVRGEMIGFDGHWKSPTGFHIVVEVKTSEVYAVKTDTLVGYVNKLISAEKIPRWDNALALYVVGRPDPEIRPLENAIVAENRIHQLHIISVESLMSLAEMMNEYDISHEDILSVIRPSGPTVDSVVDLMARLAAEQKTRVDPSPPEPPEKKDDVVHWLTPVKPDDVQTAEEAVETLVGKEKVYAFGERTPGRRHIKPGDRICFYSTGRGIIAHAEVTSLPEKKHHPKVRRPEKYPWVFTLGGVTLYPDEPVVVDADMRSRLDVFQGRDPSKSWSWFVQSTRKVTKHDFDMLTR